MKVGLLLPPPLSSGCGQQEVELMASSLLSLLTSAGGVALLQHRTGSGGPDQDGGPALVWSGPDSVAVAAAVLLTSGMRKIGDSGVGEPGGRSEASVWTGLSHSRSRSKRSSWEEKNLFSRGQEKLLLQNSQRFPHLRLEDLRTRIQSPVCNTNTVRSGTSLLTGAQSSRCHGNDGPIRAQHTGG